MQAIARAHSVTDIMNGSTNRAGATGTSTISPVISRLLLKASPAHKYRPLARGVSVTSLTSCWPCWCTSETTATMSKQFFRVTTSIQDLDAKKRSQELCISLALLPSACRNLSPSLLHQLQGRQKRCDWCGHGRTTFLEVERKLA